MPGTTRKSAAKPAAKPASETEYGEKEDGSLSGNLTREFDLRFTPTGRAVASSSVAVNERVKNEETGTWEDTEPEFYDITVWGAQAENVCEVFLKGDRIVAVGYFQDQTYTSRQSGERVTRTGFTAKDIGPSLLFRAVEIKRTQRSSKLWHAPYLYRPSGS